MSIDGACIDRASLSLISPHTVSSHVRSLNAAVRGQCLAAASLATYSSAWSAWMFCADFYGFNAACTDAAGAPLPLPACFDILDLFIGFECGLRQISPLSIRNTYIPGIAKVFDMSRFINNFRAAANHNITKCLLDGYDNPGTSNIRHISGPKFRSRPPLPSNANRSCPPGACPYPGSSRGAHLSRLPWSVPAASAHYSSVSFSYSERANSYQNPPMPPTATRRCAVPIYVS